jgi:hypothetical protein
MITMPLEFVRCWRAASPPQFNVADCFLFGGHYVPPGNADPCCRECIGWIFLREAYALHVLAGGDRLPISEFYRRHVIGNPFTERVKETAKSLAWHTHLP